MEKRDTADRPSSAPDRDRDRARAQTATDRWLDCALEATFPASDPIASNVFD